MVFHQPITQADGRINLKGENNSHMFFSATLIDRGHTGKTSQSIFAAYVLALEHQTKWHWQVHCAPQRERESVANRLALFLGIVV